MLKTILTLCALSTLAGCAGYPARQYQWSSQQGKTCFYTCEKELHQCFSQCGSAIPCRDSCVNATYACRSACPDLIEISAKE
jgi:hypothetical protein